MQTNNSNSIVIRKMLVKQYLHPLDGQKLKFCIMLSVGRDMKTLNGGIMIQYYSPLSNDVFCFRYVKFEMSV